MIPLPDWCFLDAQFNDIFASSTAVLLEDVPNTSRHLRTLLGHAPLPHEQPRIERQLAAFQRITGRKTAAFSIANARTYDAQRHGGYMRLKRVHGIEVILAEDANADDPVDAFIQARVREAGAGSHIVVWSHDGDYASDLDNLLHRGGNVSILGFVEHLAPALTNLTRLGADLWDVEHDLALWDMRLPNRPSFREVLIMKEPARAA